MGIIQHCTKHSEPFKLLWLQIKNAIFAKIIRNIIKKLTSPFEPIRFSFCRRLQNQTRTVSRSISSSSASFDISADVGREFRKNDISRATKNQHMLTRDHQKLNLFTQPYIRECHIQRHSSWLCEMLMWIK